MFKALRALVDGFTELLARQKQTEQWMQDRIESMHRDILTMKREGYTAPPVAMQRAFTPALPEQVMEAINLRARPGQPLYSELMEAAEGMLLTEVHPEEVADAILNGGDTEAFDA